MGKYLIILTSLALMIFVYGCPGGQLKGGKWGTEEPSVEGTEATGAAEGLKEGEAATTGEQLPAGVGAGGEAPTCEQSVPETPAEAEAQSQPPPPAEGAPPPCPSCIRKLPELPSASYLFFKEPAEGPARDVWTKVSNINEQMIKMFSAWFLTLASDTCQVESACVVCDAYENIDAMEAGIAAQEKDLALALESKQPLPPTPTFLATHSILKHCKRFVLRLETKDNKPCAASSDLVYADPENKLLIMASEPDLLRKAVEMQSASVTTCPSCAPKSWGNIAVSANGAFANWLKTETFKLVDLTAGPENACYGASIGLDDRPKVGAFYREGSNERISMFLSADLPLVSDLLTRVTQVAQEAVEEQPPLPELPTLEEGAPTGIDKGLIPTPAEVPGGESSLPVIDTKAAGTLEPAPTPTTGSVEPTPTLQKSATIGTSQTATPDTSTVQFETIQNKPKTLDAEPSNTMPLQGTTQTLTPVKTTPTPAPTGSSSQFQPMTTPTTIQTKTSSPTLQTGSTPTAPSVPSTTTTTSTAPTRIISPTTSTQTQVVAPTRTAVPTTTTTTPTTLRRTTTTNTSPASSTTITAPKTTTTPTQTQTITPIRTVAPTGTTTTPTPIIKR